VPRGLLFGALAGTAMSGGLQFQLVHRAFDFENQALLGAGGRDDAVLRLGAALGLQVFLQARLGVLFDGIRVDLRQRGGNNIQTDVSLRGSTFGQTLVLLNGMRLNDVQSGHHNMDVPVPVESLERVEILKGSGSTLYGSDAIGGVVNFITSTPEASEFRIRGAAGSFGTNQERVAGTLVRSRFTEQLAVYRDFSTGFIPNRDYRNLALSSSTFFRTRLGTSSILLASNDKPFGAEQFYGNYNSWERTRTWWASGQQAFGERTQASFAYRRHTDLFVLYRDRPQVFTNRLSLRL